MNTQAIDTAKSLQRIQKYLDRLAIAKGYHKECIHAFIDKDGAEIPLLATDLKALLQQVATTHPTKQGLDARVAAIEADRQHKGEPVTWVTADTVDGQTVNGKTRRIWWENNEGVGIPIYAAPQPPEAAPVQMPKPVGWFHRHPEECKNGEVCNYKIASGDRKDGWEESPLYTEQQVRDLLAATQPAAQGEKE